MVFLAGFFHKEPFDSFCYCGRLDNAVFWCCCCNVDVIINAFLSTLLFSSPGLMTLLFVADSVLSTLNPSWCFVVSSLMFTYHVRALHYEGFVHTIFLPLLLCWLCFGCCWVIIYQALLKPKFIFLLLIICYIHCCLC